MVHSIIRLEVAKDSAFPFRANDKVKIRIDTQNNS